MYSVEIIFQTFITECRGLYSSKDLQTLFQYFFYLKIQITENFSRVDDNAKYFLCCGSRVMFSDFISN